MRSMLNMKKPITRDRKGLDKTLRYLIHDRRTLPTTVKKVAADLGISKGAASARLSTLTDSGKVKRVVKGLYRSATDKGWNSQTSMALSTQSDPNAELLDHLLKEREQIDIKIAAVRDVISMHKAMKP